MNNQNYARIGEYSNIVFDKLDGKDLASHIDYDDHIYVMGEMEITYRYKENYESGMSDHYYVTIDMKVDDAIIKHGYGYPLDHVDPAIASKVIEQQEYEKRLNENRIKQGLEPIDFSKEED